MAAPPTANESSMATARKHRNKPRHSDHAHGKPGEPHGKRAGSPPDWTIIGLAIFGIALTGYLSISALWSTAPAFCAAGSGCDIIQSSRWSTFLGMPIALWGLGLYALIAIFAAQPNTRLKRWRTVWRLSLIGVAISVYLTLVGWIALQATCWWCLLSLITITAIFVLTHLRRPESAPGVDTGWNSWLLNNGAIALVLVAVIHLYSSGLFQPSASPRVQALVKHLNDSGVKYYGAFWCPVCQQQREVFASAADDLPYVECHPAGRNGPVAIECVNANLPGFPTWVIRGRQHNRLMQPEELARLTGFNWDNYKAE